MTIGKTEVDEIFTDETHNKLMEYILKFDANNKFTYGEDEDISDEQKIKLDALNETFEEILKHIEKDEIKLSAIDLEKLIKTREILLNDYPNQQNLDD